MWSAEPGSVPRGRVGYLNYETVELWTSHLATDAAGLVGPKKLADLPGPWPARTCIGDGWIAVDVTFKDVRLYRISDGEERRLPEVPGLNWYSGHFLRLVISGGAVWVQTALDPGPSDARYITRFEIDKLPAPNRATLLLFEPVEP